MGGREGAEQRTAVLESAVQTDKRWSQIPFSVGSELLGIEAHEAEWSTTDYVLGA